MCFLTLVIEKMAVELNLEERIAFKMSIGFQKAKMGKDFFCSVHGMTSKASQCQTHGIARSLIKKA